MRRHAVLLFLVATTSASAQSGASRYPFKPVPLPDSSEIALAVSAAPSEVTDKATVYAVRDGNVLTLREGSNGVACLVARDLHEGGLYPICFNAEGVRTVMQRELMQVRLRSLGATEDSVIRMVVGGGARLVAAGVLIGVPVALALSRTLASLLFETSASDPATIAAAVAALGAVAVAASWVPAWRASRVAPVEALRGS